MKKLILLLLLIPMLASSQTISTIGIYNYKDTVNYYTETTYNTPFTFSFDKGKLTIFQNKLSSTFDAVKEDNTFVVKFNEYKIVYYVDEN